MVPKHVLLYLLNLQVQACLRFKYAMLQSGVLSVVSCIYIYIYFYIHIIHVSQYYFDIKNLLLLDHCLIFVKKSWQSYLSFLKITLFLKNYSFRIVLFFFLEEIISKIIFKNNYLLHYYTEIDIYGNRSTFKNLHIEITTKTLWNRWRICSTK